MNILKLSVLLTGLILSAGTNASLLFQDDFESGSLAPNWISITGFAQIVSDPIQGDKALNFSQRKSGGDTFSLPFTSTTANSYILSFDYLGICSTNDCGGYIGYSNGLPGNHVWLEGTGTAALASNLIDDGAWHSYSVTFTSQVGPSIRVMLEDFIAPGLNAYFDNIMVTDLNGIDPESVPEPASTVLLGLALIALGITRQKSISGNQAKAVI